MDRLQAYADWLVANEDKKGTPDFETVVSAYRSLRPAPEPTPEAPRRSGLAEFGHQLKEGVTREIPTMVGQATQWFAPEDSSAGQWGKEVADKYKLSPAEEEANQRAISGRGVIPEYLMKGARALPASALGMAAGIAGTTMGAPVVGAGLAGAGIMGLFGGQQAQQTREKLEAEGISPELAKEAGWKSGLIEGGGEAIGDVLGGKFITGAAKGVGALFGKKSIEEALATATNPKWLANFGKDMLGNTAVQATTEYGQGYGETAVENAYAPSLVAKQNPHEQGMEGAKTAIAMSALLMPLGIGPHVSNANARKQLGDMLDNPNLPNEVKVRAAEATRQMVQPSVGADVADTWFDKYIQSIKDYQQQQGGAAIEDSFMQQAGAQDQTRAEQAAQQQRNEEAAVIHTQARNQGLGGLGISDIRKQIDDSFGIAGLSKQQERERQAVVKAGLLTGEEVKANRKYMDSLGPYGQVSPEAEIEDRLNALWAQNTPPSSTEQPWTSPIPTPEEEEAKAVPPKVAAPITVDTPTKEARKAFGAVLKDVRGPDAVENEAAHTALHSLFHGTKTAGNMVERLNTELATRAAGKNGRKAAADLPDAVITAVRDTMLQKLGLPPISITPATETPNEQPGTVRSDATPAVQGAGVPADTGADAGSVSMPAQAVAPTVEPAPSGSSAVASTEASAGQPDGGEGTLPPAVTAEKVVWHDVGGKHDFKVQEKTDEEGLTDYSIFHKSKDGHMHFVDNMPSLKEAQDKAAELKKLSVRYVKGGNGSQGYVDFYEPQKRTQTTKPTATEQVQSDEEPITPHPAETKQAEIKTRMKKRMGKIAAAIASKSGAKLDVVPDEDVNIISELTGLLADALELGYLTVKDAWAHVRDSLVAEGISPGIFTEDQIKRSFEDAQADHQTNTIQLSSLEDALHTLNEEKASTHSDETIRQRQNNDLKARRGRNLEHVVDVAYAVTASSSYLAKSRAKEILHQLLVPDAQVESIKKKLGKEKERFERRLVKAEKILPETDLHKQIKLLYTRLQELQEQGGSDNEVGRMQKKIVATEAEVRALTPRKNRTKSEPPSVRTLTEKEINDLGIKPIEGFKSPVRSPERTPGAGMKQGAVSAIAEGIKKYWIAAPEMEVVQRLGELPARLATRLKNGGWGDTPGIFDPATKKVWLIADNLSSDEDAYFTVIHEAVGHYGLRTVLGDKYSPTMNQAYANPHIKAAADANMQNDPEMGKELAVEEAIAGISEKVYHDVSSVRGFVDRIVGAVRKFIRDTFGQSTLKSLSDAEIRNLIRSSTSLLETGLGGSQSAPTEGEAVRSPARPIDPAAAAQLGQDKELDIPNTELTYKQRVEAIKKTHLFDWALGKVAWHGEGIARTLNELTNGQIFSALGKLRGDMLLSQLASAYKVEESVRRRGGLKQNTDGSWESVETGTALLDVFKQLKVMQDRLGGSSKDMQNLAQRALLALDSEAAATRYAKGMADVAALRAKGKKSEADAKEAKLIQPRLTTQQIANGKAVYAAHPEIKEIQRIWKAYNDGLTDNMVKAGNITPAVAAEWKANSAYVPLYRVQDDAETNYRTGAAFPSGGLNDITNRKKREAGENFVDGDVDIFSNMADVSRWKVSTIMRNSVADTLAYTPGIAEVNSAGKVLEYKDVKSAGDKAGKLVRIFKNGEPVFIPIAQPENLMAFFGSEPPVLQGLAKVFQTGARLTRAGTTMNPAFVLMQVFSKDPIRAAFTSGVKNPFAVAAAVPKNFIQLILGGKKAEKLALEKQGIIGAVDSGTSHITDRAMEKEVKLINKTWTETLTHWGELLATTSDMAQRIAIYDQTMKETDNESIALARARDVINFDKRGTSATWNFMRQVTPFLGGYLQGMEVLLRTARGRGLDNTTREQMRNRFIQMNLAVAGIMIAYAAMMDDDDDYNKLSDSERMRVLLIPGTGIKLPMPTDLSILFKGIPEMLTNYIVRKGTNKEVDATRAFKAIGNGIADAYSSPMGMAIGVPGVLKPVVEVGLNHSFFTGRDIVSAGYQQLATERQFTSGPRGTSELAKSITNAGRVIGIDVSPMKADHLIKGIFGMTGALAVDSSNLVFNPDRPESKLSEISGFRSFLVQDNASARKDLFYDLFKRSAEVHQTVSDMKRRSPQELREYLKDPDHQKLYQLYTPLNQQKRQLDDMRVKIAQISEAKSDRIPTDKKRPIIDLLNKREQVMLEKMPLEKWRGMVGL